MQGIMLLIASEVWVKKLNYLAAVARWILKQLTSAKNRQLARSLLDFAKKRLFAVCLPAVCASCSQWPSGPVVVSGPRGMFLPQRASAASVRVWLSWARG